MTSANIWLWHFIHKRWMTCWQSNRPLPHVNQESRGERGYGIRPSSPPHDYEGQKYPTINRVKRTKVDDRFLFKSYFHNLNKFHTSSLTCLKISSHNLRSNPAGTYVFKVMHRSSVFTVNFEQILHLILILFTVWKISVFGVILVHIFPHLHWIWIC